MILTYYYHNNRIEQYTPEPENGYKDSKRKEHTDPGSNDKTKTDQQSCPVARTQNKRNTSNEHGYEETPRKRRRSSCVADLSGGDEKWRIGHVLNGEN